MEKIFIVITAIITFILGILYNKHCEKKKTDIAKNSAENIIKDAQEKLNYAESEAINIRNNAETRKKEILLDAKEQAIKIKDDAEKEIRTQKLDIQQRETRLLKKEEKLEKKMRYLKKRKSFR